MSQILVLLESIYGTHSFERIEGGKVCLRFANICTVAIAKTEALAIARFAGFHTTLQTVSAETLAAMHPDRIR